jgi:hypothetical protein
VTTTVARQSTICTTFVAIPHDFIKTFPPVAALNLKADDEGSGRMSEAAHVGENSNAQGVRADRHSPRSSWFATGGDWLLLKWIDATKRFTAIILTLGSTILIALILALIAQGVFANTISIQAITVPKPLEERGFTAEVAATAIA